MPGRTCSAVTSLYRGKSPVASSGLLVAAGAATVPAARRKVDPAPGAMSAPPRSGPMDFGILDRSTSARARLGAARQVDASTLRIRGTKERAAPANAVTAVFGGGIEAFSPAQSPWVGQTRSKMSHNPRSQGAAVQGFQAEGESVSAISPQQMRARGSSRRASPRRTAPSAVASVPFLRELPLTAAQLMSTLLRASVRGEMKMRGRKHDFVTKRRLR